MVLRSECHCILRLLSPRKQFYVFFIFFSITYFLSLKLFANCVFWLHNCLCRIKPKRHLLMKHIFLASKRLICVKPERCSDGDVRNFDPLKPVIFLRQGCPACRRPLFPYCRRRRISDTSAHDCGRIQTLGCGIIN